MSTVQLVGLRQKGGTSACVCMERRWKVVVGGFEGRREIIACWCICVAGGSGIELGVGDGAEEGGVMSLPAGVSVVGAHLDLDWLCEERA